MKKSFILEHYFSGQYILLCYQEPKFQLEWGVMLRGLLYTFVEFMLATQIIKKNTIPYTCTILMFLFLGLHIHILVYVKKESKRLVFKICDQNI